MIELQTGLAFFSVALLLALAPGPDNLFVLTQAVLQGSRAGWLVTLGLCSGLILHTLAVALGVAALVQASPMAFTLLKCVGAAYLLYLAWQAFHAANRVMGTSPVAALGSVQLYRRGILMNLTNPKVLIFFLAFLPQFADPRLGNMSLQLLSFGGLFMLATLLVFGAVALSAGWLRDRFWQSARHQQLINRLAGSVFAILALRLILPEYQGG